MNILLKLKYFLGIRSLKNKRFVIKRLIAVLLDIRVKKAKVYILWANLYDRYEGIGWSYYEENLINHAKTQHYKEYYTETKYYTNAGLKLCTKTLRNFN